MHEVLSDPRGMINKFTRERNRLLANALKVHLGWPEEVFSRGGPSVVRIDNDAAAIHRITYTLTNAVEAGLVERPEDWFGVTMSASDIGDRVVRAPRPPIYFDPKNPQWPDFAEIAITLPPNLEQLFGRDTAKALIEASVNESVAIARAAAAKAGVVPLEASEAFAIPHTTRASIPEPSRKKQPWLAVAGDPELAAKAFRERAAFEEAYAAARKRLRNGETNVAFPRGTWRLHQEYGVRIADEPEPQTPQVEKPGPQTLQVEKAEPEATCAPANESCAMAKAG